MTSKCHYQSTDYERLDFVIYSAQTRTHRDITYISEYITFTDMNGGMLCYNALLREVQNTKTQHSRHLLITDAVIQ